MTELEVLIGLNLTCDIGSIRLKKLLEYFDKPADILEAPSEKLMAIAGIGPQIAKKIKAVHKKDIDREINLTQKQNIRIVTFDNDAYPGNLKYIPDPPIILYVKGNILKEDRLSIAIVGSRRASLYGLTSAEKFSAELSHCGFTIVSGMARGIDTSAHRSALKHKGRTIAVMGSGFNHIYPAENKKLMEEITQRGVVISEFPIDTLPLRENFPRRNRVISGLSLGVLIIEAARNSGALITADFALEQSREVFALPGKVDSHNSFGTHELIKQGAKLVSCVDDILEELNLPVGCSGQSQQIDKIKPSARQLNELSQEEYNLYNLISNKPLPLDEIIDKIGMNISTTYDIILRLQLRKLIRRLPGEQLVRTDNER
jgi:DNA processing protein